LRTRITSSDPPVRGRLSPGGRRYFDGPDCGWHELWLPASRVLDVCRTHFAAPAIGATLLAEGMLNQSWRISCSDHDRVLRVGRQERTVEQVARIGALTGLMWLTEDDGPMHLALRKLMNRNT
jgi:hypothetical protein